MNYKMITNHAYACTTPRETIIQKIDFVAPIFASAQISKTMNMLSKHAYGTTNINVNDNKIKMKWYKY